MTLDDFFLWLQRAVDRVIRWLLVGSAPPVDCRRFLVILHWYDKRARADIYFPRPGVADLVEERHARNRRGIMEGAACYGCVFTGGVAENLWTFARITRPRDRLDSGGEVGSIRSVFERCWGRLKV